MKSKQSKNLIITALSTLMLVNTVVPSYAINTTSSTAVGAVLTETELIDNIIIKALSSAKVRTSDELVNLGVVANLGGAPVYTEANGVAQIIGYIGAGTDVITYAEYEGFSEIIFKEQISYINSKYLEFPVTQSLESNQQQQTITGTYVDPLDALISMGVFNADITNQTAIPATTTVTTPATTTVITPATTTVTTPATTAVTAPVSTTVSTPSSKYAVVNTSSGLNLRASASTNSTVLAKLSNGTVADVIEILGGWVKVQVNGTIGYVSLDYVNLTDTKPAVATSTASTSSSKGTEVVNFAKKYIGTRYVYGGTNLSSGVDCSGFTYSVFRNFGINLNRTSQAQYSNGVAVSKANLQAGDLVFFNTGGNTSISHVGIYIGNNQYIHSTDGSGNGVCIASLNSAYALRTYYGARRVI